ncbi:fimbrillin family protein [Bacteroides gallinarum]|uniref:fimbrillin family protein n=1 Tax=Bacteroides gallinarum TaxID=376806 RepID=UPI001F493651|nr:fimbrillin family protein [Bacteroides gallinarum]
MKRSILRHKPVLWSLIAALTLASCSQDEFADNGQNTPLPVGQYPLELTADGLQAVATPAQPLHAALSSRATGTE